MKDNLQTAVVFTANLIESKNIVFLIPQKIIIGKCADDTSSFNSYLDGEWYQNIDDVVMNRNNNIGFYNVKTVGELKEMYSTKDLQELFATYIADLYTKVYYYELSEDKKFENYFMKKCSIDEFNKKFNLNFSYDFSSSNEEEEDEREIDPKTQNFKNIKSVLDSNVLFQNDAKNELISVLYNNTLLEQGKSNVIIYGPSGVGKSETLKIISDISNQPITYIKFNPNLMDNPREYLDSLLLKSNYVGLSKKVPLALHTIIIDDFDKNFNYIKMRDLLEEINLFMKDGKRFIRYEKESRTGLIIDSKYTNFIICGNFNLAEKERVINDTFFTNSDMKYEDIPLTLSKNDLQNKYGFSEEILEIFDKFIEFKPLSLEKAKKIMLCSNNSLFKIYFMKLKDQGIKLNIDEKTIELICEKVYSKRNNIKNINEVISGVFKNIMVDSLDVDECSEITITDKTVTDSKQYIIKKSSQN